MICEPCRASHKPGDCIDAVAGREYPWRHCACQHKPRTAAEQTTDACDHETSNDGEEEPE